MTKQSKLETIPKHIKDIYCHVLKLNKPLRKMIDTGVINKYNAGKMKAAYFVQYYLIESEDDDNKKYKRTKKTMRRY